MLAYRPQSSAKQKTILGRLSVGFAWAPCARSTANEDSIATAAKTIDKWRVALFIGRFSSLWKRNHGAGLASGGFVGSSLYCRRTACQKVAVFQK
jgi:hypothetical protein